LCDEYEKRDNGKKPETIRPDKSRIKVHIKPKLGKLKVAADERACRRFYALDQHW
jgi:hypothetical protein